MFRSFPYLLLIAISAMVYFIWPDQLSLAARIATMAIFVMSLDLVVGYGGLATLGHSAMFGIGAYASGLLAMHLTGNPLFGLLAGAVAGALLAALSGLFLLRYEGLTFLMLTVAIGQIAQNVASKMRDWTGGEDGLSGFEAQKLFGLWGFDLYGRVAFIYCAVIMLLCFWAMRRLMGSPFGLSVVGIHQNRVRTGAIGGSVRGQLLKLYTLGGAFAGIAGALNAQVNQIVGLDTLSFDLSAEALVMLVLGGAGNLLGAIAGTAVFMIIHHWAASINPYHWLFIIGGMLVVVVLIPREKWSKLIRQRLSVFGAARIPREAV